MKKLMIVNGSPRRNGCDAILASEASRMASEHGYESETVNVYDLNLNGCKGCMGCKKTGRCVQKDGMNDILDRIRGSDMLLLTTPVYFSGETGPFKTFIDRMYPCVTFDDDGNRMASLGNVSKVSIAVICGKPDGNMTYANIMTRYIGVMKMFGVTDAAGAVIPGVEPSTILESGYAKDFLEGFEFQIEM